MVGYDPLNIAKKREERKGNSKEPFSHQEEAFSALSKTLTLPIKGYKGTLLVLPTGGGKTFTSVNWVCRNILSRGIKVIWLAQSSYLIDQAADAFNGEIHNVMGRDIINLRVVSSSTSHANAGSILPTDDVVVCTTQTAISAYSAKPLDERGNAVKTPFGEFVENCADSQLFVVIDEAHHTPAYGCRNLLLSMREEIPNLYILGLTATPMHMDKRIRGWLNKIYDRGDSGICYEAKKEKLHAQKILAVPKYIERQTGMEFEVDDGLYDRLMNKHKDLPENIIEQLAHNQGRNNLIVSDYLNNKNKYGKTIIFADRWFQCEHIVEKLKDNGVNANAVYSRVAGQNDDFSEGSGRRDNKENERIMQDFRDGKYDVIVNVKMLTEGVDVPDVKTVMVTRQTTSNILLTQMIGRALRGEKAGGGEGKDSANIVFFYDKWKRLLTFADIRDGELGQGRPETQRRNPMELVSIQLVKLAVSDIDYKGFEKAEYLTFVPVGYYNCEYTVAVKDGSVEELVPFEDNIRVYDFNIEKYKKMIDFLDDGQDLSKYSNEDIVESDIGEKAEELIKNFFDFEKDNFDESLIDNVTKIVHHIAQNRTKPLFVDFHERDKYDLDKIARDYLNASALDVDIFLRNTFNDASLLWGYFYKTFGNFMDAYYKSQKRELEKRHGDSPPDVLVKPQKTKIGILTEEKKQEVFDRDGHTCLCCGKKRGRGLRLDVDHILPVSMGGKNALSNLQTLCRDCNALKGQTTVDYSVHESPLGKPKDELKFHGSVGGGEASEHAIARVVNNFYHCAAMRKLNAHTRSNGTFYSTWEIVLYGGNDPKWLQPHKKELLHYIHETLGNHQVTKVVVKN
jgi:superfamily II DNA or RNA helicase